MVENKGKDKIFNWIIIVIMLIFAFVTLLPLLHVIANSFSEPEAVYRGQIGLWPKSLSLVSYQRVFKESSIIQGYINTLIYTSIGTLFLLIFKFTVAFPFYRKDL